MYAIVICLDELLDLIKKTELQIVSNYFKGKKNWAFFPCPRSSYLFYIVSILDQMGNNFLDI